MEAGMRGSLSHLDRKQSRPKGSELHLGSELKGLGRSLLVIHCLGMLYLGPHPRTNFGQGQGKAGGCRKTPVSGEGLLPKGRQKATFVQLS